jgi:hypothetical protein
MRKLFLILIVIFLAKNINAQVMNYNNEISQDNANYLIKPNGKYSVGYHDFFWINGILNNKTNQYECLNHSDSYYSGQNKEDFNLNNQTEFCREIVVRIYYPTAKNNEKSDYYGPNMQSFIDGVNQYPENQYSIDKKKELIKELFDQIKSYSIHDKLKIIDENKKFPVLFFNPGAGSNVELYENLITNLVSHGYIVVGINSLFISAPVNLENNHTVQANENTMRDLANTESILLSDNEFIYNKILEEIANKNGLKLFSLFDSKKMGIFGHSVGGQAAGATVLKHPSWFKATATLEAAWDTTEYDLTKKEYPIPVLHQEGSFDHYRCSYYSIADCALDPRKFNLNSNGFLVIHQIDESQKNLTFCDHNNFSDYSTLQYHPSLTYGFEILNQTPDSQEPGLLNLFLGTGNGWKLTQSINKYLLQFFNSILKDGDEHPFGDCSQPLTINSKLICGPASGV